MMLYHVYLGLGWIVYCALHSIMAASAFKARVERLTGLKQRSYRLWYNIFAFLTLIPLLIWQFTISSYQLFHSSFIQTWLSALVTIIGAVIMIICIIKYFRQLSGVRFHKQQSIQPNLEITGIHRYVRHPLYLGTFIFIAGLFLAFPTLANLITVVIIIGYTSIAIKFEEQKLVKVFGEDYIKYAKEVPMLVPFT